MKNIFRNILNAAACGALLLGASACSDNLLDIEQPGVNGVSTYVTADNQQTKQFIAAVYATILGNSYQSVLVAGGEPASYRSLQYELSRMSDETADGYKYNESSDANTYAAIYGYYYRWAYWCNMILENLPENEVCDADVKTQVLAEARAIRAIAMMNLVQLFGNPPLADHILDGSEGNTPAAESWAFIESELTTAAADLPTKSGLDGQSTIGGRLTREAAYAYLGKAYLWQGKYSQAASTLHDKVIATGKYDLVSDFATLNSSAIDFSCENLWEYNFADESSAETAQDGSFDLICFSADFGVYSTTYGSLYMSFGMGAYPSQEFATFMGTHDATAYGTTTRYQQTLCDYPSALMSYQAMFMNYPYTIASCQGYFKVKDLTLIDDLCGQLPNWFSRRNTVYLRYAEVLLDYAEAVAQGGSNGSSLTGLEALNKVRTRAGLDAATSLTMDDATCGVKAERRAELYAEGCRFIDLVRWGDAATVLADCGKTSYSCTINEAGSMEIPGFGAFTLYDYTVAETATGAPGFKAGKNELFPIPATDINNNPALEQNPGW